MSRRLAVASNALRFTIHGGTRPSAIWKRSVSRIAKGTSRNKRAIWRVGIRRDGVIPLAVEFGLFDVDGGHLGIGDGNALGVLASVEFAAHGEAGFGGGG